MVKDIFFLKIFLLIKEVLIFGLIGFFVALLVAPLAFLKTQRQQTGLDYIKLFNYNRKKYGYLIFYSGTLHFAILHSMAAATFGLVESFSIPAIKLIFDPYSFYGIVLRTFVLGFCETCLILYFDYKAIYKQKVELIEDNEMNLLNFFKPAFFKNTIIWFGATFSIFIIHFLKEKSFYLQYSYKIFLSFVLGAFFAFFALPFDIICVKRAGSLTYSKKSMFMIWKDCIFEKKSLKRIFSGALLRILILAIFTVSLVLTNIFLKK